MTFAGVKKALSGSTFYGCFGWKPMRKLSSKQNKKKLRGIYFRSRCATGSALHSVRLLIIVFFQEKNSSNHNLTLKMEQLLSHRWPLFQPTVQTTLTTKRKKQVSTCVFSPKQILQKTKMCAKKENKVTPRKKLH